MNIRFWPKPVAHQVIDSGAGTYPFQPFAFFGDLMDPRQVLKEKLVPRIREKGFKGSFPHFRRHRDNRNELLTIQFDKYGTGRFVIELGVAPYGDFETYYGKVIAPGKLTAHDLGERMRLGAKSTGQGRWFEIKARPQSTIEEILGLIDSEADEYFL